MSYFARRFWDASKKVNSPIKANRSNKKGGKKKIYLEPLEPRLLLSADLAMQMVAGANDLTLQLQKVQDVDTIQLVNNADQSIVQSQALADTSSIIISGTDQNDRLVVDYSNPLGDLSITFSDTSQTDSDTLQITGKDQTTWTINDNNTGWGETAKFSGIENLTGDAGNEDTFIVTTGGGLAGTMDGGAGGFDSVVLEGSYASIAFQADGPDAGTIGLDGQLIRYIGMEPITHDPDPIGSTPTDITFTATANNDVLTISQSGDQITINGPNIESHTFTAPTASLTINTGGGQDLVTVTSLDLGTADLTINAESIGVNGTVVADDITLTASDENTGDFGYVPTAIATMIFDEDQAMMAMSDAMVDLTGATLTGSNITISATSTSTLTPSGFTLSGFAFAFAYASADSQVILDNTTINAANLDIDATSTINATAEISGNMGNADDETDAAVAVVVADGEATARISGNSHLKVAGIASLTATNNITAIALADGTDTDAGATLALAIVDGKTRSYIADTASIDDITNTNEATSINIGAVTSSTTTTTAKSTPDGAQESSGSGRKSQSALSDPNRDGDNKDQASTSEGSVNFAAAVAISNVINDTQAYISSSGAIVSDGNLNISATTTSIGTTEATGNNTASGATGVGVAVAIGVANVDTVSYVAGSANFTADAINVSANLLPASAFSTTAIAGTGADDVGVAGALALNVTNVTTEALVKAGANVNAHGGDLTLSATGTLSVITKATSKVDAGDSSVGIGASVALTISDVDTRAEVENTVVLTDVRNLSLAATTTPTINTTAEAGAAGGGSVAIGGAVAITIADNTTITRVGTGSATTLGGTLTLDAAQVQGSTTTLADGTAAGDSVGIGAAIALAVTSDETLSTIERVLLCGAGDSKIEATTVAKVETTAKASASGNKDKEGDSSDDTATQQKDKQKSFANSKADAAESEAGSGEDAGEEDDSDATTSDGAVGVAAAIAVNVSDVTAQAAVLSNLTTGGALTVHSGANADVIAIADGQAVDPDNADVGVGVAVAVNVADLSNTAYIGSSVTVNTAGLTLTADMADRSGESPDTHTFKAEATSGAGAGDVGVAGSVAINIVDDTTEAVLRSGSTIDNAAASDVTLSATNTVGLTTKAKADTTGGVGVGASVALTISDVDTRAEVENTVVLTDVRNLSLAATTTPTINTTAEAGAAGDDVAVGGAVAITIADNTTITRVGTGSATILGGTLTLDAAQVQGTTTTLADGTAAGGSVGVGVALGLAITSNEAMATTERALTANGAGDSKIEATTVAKVETTAKASASGAEDKEGDSSDDTANAQKDKQKNFANTKADAAGSDAGSGEDTGETTDASTSDGAVGVAAGIAINISDITAQAAVLSNLTTGGVLTVHSGANADVIAIADGQAVDPDNADVGVGVAVAINLADLSNTAYIGSGITLNTAGLTLTADMADRSDEATDTHTFTADATSGAGAKDVGVAGSVAVNIVDAITRAEVRAGATVGVDNGVFNVEGVSTTNSTTKAQPTDGGGSGDVGIGASVAVAVITNTTVADVQDGASVSGYDGGKPTNVSVNATGNYATTTEAQNGAAGDSVAVAAAVAVAVVDNTTTARIGTGVTLPFTGNAEIIATHDSVVDMTVKSEASGEVGVGVSVGVTVVNEIVEATLARGLGLNADANGNVTVKADADTASTVSVTASASGSKSQDEGGRDADSESSAQVNNNSNVTNNKGSQTLPSASTETSSASSSSSSESGSGSSGVGGRSGRRERGGCQQYRFHH